MEEGKKVEEKELNKVEKKESVFNAFNIFLIGIIVVLIIVAAVLFFSNKNPSGLSSSQRATLAQELSARNITLYTTSTCPHCKAQKALFGAEIRYLRVVTCDIQPDEFCGTLSAVPTWRLPDGEIITGVLEFKNLQELIVGCTLTGCNLQGSFDKVNISG
jgi:hypothetical protein